MIRRWLAAAAAACLALPAAAAPLCDVVGATVRPLMRQYGIPGMAVGVAAGGEASVCTYGVASTATGAAVTPDTLFEIGSLSKTFTATLAAYAAVEGKLSLGAPVAAYVPALRGTASGRVSLLELGTHTTGGMPLQAPDAVTDDAAMMRWFRQWRPAQAPGSVRTYSNLSIGLLGVATAAAMHQDFATAMRESLLAPLGLRHTYLAVPPAAMADYALGTTRAGAPIRLAPGPLASEAYGIRTTAADLLRVLQANLGLLAIPAPLQRAIDATHTGYFRIAGAGGMTQDLIWEQYAAPVSLPDLLAGNGDDVVLHPHAAAALRPPRPPGNDVLLDKTGSTNGFGNYALFVPGRKIALVLLANRNYPIAARVAAAYRILSALGGGAVDPLQQPAQPHGG